MRELLAQSQFVAAHRGSGDNWTEHSLEAYTSSLAAGAAAVEISVGATSDGVLICHHDLSSARLLGVDAALSSLAWAQVSALQLDARAWLGPNTPLLPVARFEDVLDALGPKVLAFVEDKQGTNTRAILDLLDRQPSSTQRFIWKQWAPAAQAQAARKRGYATWGYLDSSNLGRAPEFASTFDALGVPIGMTDAQIASVVAAGRPVISWEVHFRGDVERLQSLGVAGMMCSNVPYILGDSTVAKDAFASGRRSPGDLPARMSSLGWAAQPTMVPERAALRMDAAGLSSYLMGSLAPASGAVAKSVSATFVWPDAVGGTANGIGIAFGLDNDAAPGDALYGTANGYLFSVRSDGTLSLSQIEGGKTSVPVATRATGPIAAGEPVDLRIEIAGSTITVERKGDASWSIVQSATSDLGPWTRLVKLYPTAIAVEFSRVSVAN